MTRALLVAALLALAIGGTVVYQAAARQRAYETRIARGDAALGDDQTFAAIEAYSGAIELRSDSMLAYLRRGETYQRRGDRGDLDLAARDFRTAASLDPGSTRSLEELGDVLYQLHRYDRAAEAFERCARIDDRLARVVFKLALARYHNGDFDAAMASAAQALRLDDKISGAYYVLGLSLREKGRTADALAALEKAVAVEPASIPVREELAELYASLDRRSDELVQLQLLAGLDRTHAERQVALGMAHARAHRYELAVLTLGNALERTPNDLTLHAALGRVWLDAARTRDDRDALAKALEALSRAASDPNASSEVLTLYGRALLQDDDSAGAERVLRRATTTYPVDPESLMLYATAAERERHVAAAREALIQYGVLTADKSDVAGREARIASLSLRLKEPDVAIAWLQRAQLANPNDARLASALADARALQERKDRKARKEP
jgi:tetratricopeptide (TPR) repeat protein